MANMENMDIQSMATMVITANTNVISRQPKKK